MNDLENGKTYAIFDTAANRKIIGDLGKSGAKVFLFPPIETERTVLNEREIGNLTNFGNFDWLIFADVFAVDYFLEILEEKAVDAFDLDDARVCAVGVVEIHDNQSPTPASQRFLSNSPSSSGSVYTPEARQGNQGSDSPLGTDQVPKCLPGEVRFRQNMAGSGTR